MWVYAGVFFGPAVTKWFQLLNRLKFSTPVKGTIFRVRPLLLKLYFPPMLTML